MRHPTLGDIAAVGGGVFEMRIASRVNHEEVPTFDSAEYLDSDAVVPEYLNAALEDGNPGLFTQTIAGVAKARGMTQLAKDTGLGRESSQGLGSRRQAAL